MLTAENADVLTKRAKNKIQEDTLEFIKSKVEWNEVFLFIENKVIEAIQLGHTATYFYRKDISNFPITENTVYELLRKLGYQCNPYNSSYPIEERIFISWNK